ncbi:DUF4097 family beta strand repeat-containing protein [Alkalihalobacillus deserti]|uniref:DUF4097 family beta strand repeat-containing protein n=1 Tax=Alkalihalobacillus deserti TaxID=2879466 RepID=UPI001D13BEB4|nr:DUF4097 family beta strand repeat-containing protein [Alkalihalobacillus deserti]
MIGIKRWLISAMILVALTGCNIITYEHEETFTLDGEGVTTLNINHDEGDVTVKGVEGIDQITVTAIFAAWSDDSVEHAQTFSEENLSVELFSENEEAFLKTAVNRRDKPEQGFIHLQIEVPSHVAIEYRQNEGQLQIESMRSDLNIQHGTNQLVLKDIQGNIQIIDGAGNVSLEGVSGEIVINNNAGATKVTNSIGVASIIAGSGQVEINEHEGDVTVRSGQGNIDINDVNGDVTILESRDGMVTIENVSGKVNQP